jgi:hypothetical protein
LIEPGGIPCRRWKEALQDLPGLGLAFEIPRAHSINSGRGSNVILELLLDFGAAKIGCKVGEHGVHGRLLKPLRSVGEVVAVRIVFAWNVDIKQHILDNCASIGLRTGCC